jgi:hypothetical protein
MKSDLPKPPQKILKQLFVTNAAFKILNEKLKQKRLIERRLKKLNKEIDDSYSALEICQRRTGALLGKWDIK